MSTRSLTVVSDENGKELLNMYRHWDGYPKGHGKELAEFLKGKVITNGLVAGNTANGMEELAAQLLCHFKAKHPSGTIYLYPAHTSDLGEEFLYTVYFHKMGIEMAVHSVNGGKPTTLLWSGNPANFDALEEDES